MTRLQRLGLAAGIAAMAAAEASASKISNVVITDKPNAAAPEAIAVTADPAAQYALVEWKQLGNGNRIALVRRSAGAAESFTRLEFSCANRVFRPLGQGKTAAAASNPAPAVGFAPLAADSVSGQVGAHVCRKKYTTPK